MGRAVGRKELSEMIHDRLGGSVPLAEIYTAVGIIVDEVGELLVNEPVTAKNFGTLSPYLFHGHRARNVNSGEVENMAAFRSVRFHASRAFDELLCERRKGFEENSGLSKGS